MLPNITRVRPNYHAWQTLLQLSSTSWQYEHEKLSKQQLKYRISRQFELATSADKPLMAVEKCVHTTLLLAYYYAPHLHREGHYKIMAGVRLSVCPFVRPSICLSVCRFLDLTRQWKGPYRSPKLASWKPIAPFTRLTREPILRSKGQRSRSLGRLMLS